MLLSELSNFIRNHLHLKVPMEVGVCDIPRCINDIPKYFVLKSLNDVSVMMMMMMMMMMIIIIIMSENRKETKIQELTL